MFSVRVPAWIAVATRQFRPHLGNDVLVYPQMVHCCRRAADHASARRRRSRSWHQPRVRPAWSMRCACRPTRGSLAWPAPRSSAAHGSVPTRAEPRQHPDAFSRRPHRSCPPSAIIARPASIAVRVFMRRPPSVPMKRGRSKLKPAQREAGCNGGIRVTLKYRN